ncbi:MAG: D-sedoheptulose 7-phosphate isomerase [candidate division KSB1 bacterium]|nr:D-sedoheptulose 7-phosphate isomerase [candidate division KSB1 bacterium]
MTSITPTMIDKVQAQFAASAALLRQVAELQAARLAEVARVMIEAMRAGRKIMVCGNGGSAADAQHFAAEMIGRFRKERAPLPTLALSTDTSVLTAVGNDYGFERVFVRQVEGLGVKGDVLVGISTSGNSANVAEALRYARAHGITTVGILGSDGGIIAQECDYALIVPSKESARIQECHAVIIHALCDLVEEELAHDSGRAR